MSSGQLPEGTVTILFTDVEGSTGLGVRAGDEEARRILRAHESLIRSYIDKHGGIEIKSLGDGFMVGFTSARRALDCAVEIQRALESQEASDPDALRVRIGLNAGEVIHEEGDLFGGAVAAAARISSHAKGGEILISEVVRSLVGTIPGLEFLDRGPVALRGFTEPWRLFEVRWVETPEDAGARRTPFVGRPKERTILRSALDRMGEGRGGMVLIGGEPGVGKTRLSEEALIEARRREFRALVGRCYESDSPPPYLPFVEVLNDALTEVDAETFRLALGDAAGEVAKIMPRLRSVYDDIPPPLDIPPEVERRFLFNSIAEFIERAAANRPLVVLLDDLHWADEASLLLLQHVVHRLEGIPVLLIGTYRDVELDAQRPFATTLSKLIRDHLAQRIDLKRHDLEDVAEMLQRLADSPPPRALVEAIYQESDGNAFFVEEVFTHFKEEGRLFDEAGRWRSDLSVEDLEVPESVRLVLGRRVQRLGEEARNALVAAALKGRAFDLSFLEQMMDISSDELLDAVDEAENAGLIACSVVRGTPTYRFVHELVRQTLIAGISLPRRQRLHLKVAEALEAATKEPKDRAEEIAAHLFQAGAAADPDKTISYLIAAGDTAIEGAAYEEGVRYFDDALSLDPSDDHTRAELEYRRGLGARGLGRVEESIERWKSALDLYERTGDARGAGQVAVDLAFQLSWVGRWEETAEVGGRGLAIIGDEHLELRVRLLTFIGVVTGYGGDYPNALSMIEAAERVIEEEGGGRPEVIGWSLSSRTVLQWGFAEFDDACAAARKSSMLQRQVGDLWILCNVLAFWAMSACHSGRLGEAEEVLAELDPLATKIGHLGSLVLGERVKMSIGWSRGQGRDALEEFARRDLALNERGQLPWRSQAYSYLGRAKLWAGDVPGALADAELGAKIDPPGATWGMSLGERFAIECWARPEMAESMIEEIRGHLPKGWPAPIGAWELLFQFVEGIAILGRSDDGALHDLMTVALEHGWVLTVPGKGVRLLAGTAAYLGQRWSQAEEHFAAAETRAKEWQCDIDLADIARHRAWMLARRDPSGSASAAVELLEEAARRYGSLGMKLLEDDCLRRVAILGAPS